MSSSGLDPCLAIGFYIRNREDFERFWEQAKVVTNK
jgi:hypothetical protein